MEAIYSSSALQTRQREIKGIARKRIVHITENGNGAFVFCSEEVFQRALDEARAEAAAEAVLAAVVERGRADFEAGRVFESTDDAFAEVERRVALRD